MRYRKLGATELEVSEIGFGGFAIGGYDYGPTDDAESIAALERACELGVTFFDTADLYGDGHSENLVGRVVAERCPEAVVATKVGFVGGMHGGGRSAKDFRRTHIVAAAERSLRRLRREVIDLYQLHNPTVEDLASGEAFEAMEELVAAGKVRFWGVSAGTRDAVAVCRAALARPSALSVQLVCNLFHHDALDALAPDLAARRMAVVARAPLEYGVLTGKLPWEPRFAPGDHRNWRWSPEELALRLGQVAHLARAFAGRPFSLSQLVLGFSLASPAVSVVICGAKTAAQLEENVAAAEIAGRDLTEEDLALAAWIAGESGPAGKTIVPACTCPKTFCERHRRCDACVAYHGAKDTLAHCFRPTTPEGVSARPGPSRTGGA